MPVAVYSHSSCRVGSIELAACTMHMLGSTIIDMHGLFYAQSYYTEGAVHGIVFGGKRFYVSCYTTDD